MSEISFSKQHKDILVAKVQAYCEQQLNLEIGQFDAEFLLDFSPKSLAHSIITKVCKTPKQWYRVELIASAMHCMKLRNPLSGNG